MASEHHFGKCNISHTLQHDTIHSSQSDEWGFVRCHVTQCMEFCRDLEHKSLMQIHLHSTSVFLLTQLTLCYFGGHFIKSFH